MSQNNSAQRVINYARHQQKAFLLRDFFTFAKHSGICPDITEEEHRDACDFLESRIPRRAYKGQTLSQAKRMFALFMMPRLTFKTSLISALCIFAMLVDLVEIGRIDIRIVLGRATTDDAGQTLYGIKTNLERNPVLRSAFGDLRALFDKWTDDFITAGLRDGGIREPTIGTTGLNTSETGSHPDLVILDDLVHELNYQSAAHMARARVLIQAFYPIIERWGSLLVVGTRWGDNDVYGWILDQEEKKVEAGGERRWQQYIVGAYYEDTQQVRFPNLLPEWRIQELRDDLDPKLFAAWILNQARAEGEKIFTTAYVQYVDAEYIGGPFGELELLDTRENAAYLKRFGKRIPLAIVVLIDPAPTVGPKSDATGIVVLGFDPDRNWWVLYANEMRKLPSERLNHVLFLARQYEPSMLAVENADMDAPLLQDRLREMGLQTKVVSFNPRLDRKKITADAKLAPRGRTKKEAQIEATEPVLRAKRVFFVRGMTAPLVSQLTKYPYLDHDDVLDAFSMGKAYEQRPELVAESDPVKTAVRVSKQIEAREYELEGLDEDGNDLEDRIFKKPRRRGAWSGPRG